MLDSPDQQISLTDPDSRSMATSGRGSGVVYNVQVAVDTEHHLIVAHEVTKSGSDRAQLANMAREAKAVLQTEALEAVADRGYFSSPEILVVLQGSGYRIAIQTKKPTRCCGAIGPTPVKTVQSNPSARPGQSDGSRDGTTSICRRCAAAP